MSEQNSERSAQVSIAIPYDGCFCAKCGHKNGEDSIFCTKCGHKLCENSPVISSAQNSSPPKKKTNVFSVLSIIFSCLGIIPAVGLLFLLVALVLGIIGLATMKNKNKGPTIASGVAIYVFFIIFMVSTFVFSKGNSEANPFTTEEQYISSSSVITTDYFEVYVDGVYISKEFSSKSAPEGMRYCYVKGTINNNTFDELKIDISGNFSFDGVNIYEGLFSISNNSANNAYEVTNYALIEAHRDKVFYFTCLIPEEVADGYTSAEVTFELVGADAPGPYSISFSD